MSNYRHPVLKIRRIPVWAVLIVVMIGFGWSVYFQHAREFFFFADDWRHIRISLADQGDLHLEDWWPWVRALRPVGFSFVAVMVNAFGLRPQPYHYVQLTLHIFSASLLMLALWYLTKNVWAAFAGAMTFMVNRFAYLPIVWVASVFDTLAALFLIIALLAYMYSSANTTIPGWVSYGVALLFACLALRTKEQTAMGLMAMGVCAYWSSIGRLVRTDTILTFAPLRLRIDRADLPKLGRLAGLALVVGMAFYGSPLLGQTSPAHPYYLSFSPDVLVASFGWYLGQLTFLPNWPPLGVIVLFGVGTLWYCLRRHKGIGTLGWLIWWLTLLPTAALPNHFDYLNYPYVPMIGIAIMVADVLSSGMNTSADAVKTWGITLAVLAFVGGSIWWLYGSNEIRWYQQMSLRAERIMQELKLAFPADNPSSQVLLMGLPPDHPFVYGDGIAANVWLSQPSLRVIALEPANAYTITNFALPPDAPILYWDTRTHSFIRLR